MKLAAIKNMKHWGIPIFFESVGVVIFSAGLLYYIFLVRIPRTGEKLTREFVERLLFRWGVSARIMTTGGVLILIGFISLLVVITATLVLKKEFKGFPLSALSRGRNSIIGKFKRYLLLTVPFVILILFHFVNHPINKKITVVHFGCGCPKLDGSYDFDANCFNAVLWTVVLFASVFLWTYFSKDVFKNATRLFLILTGIWMLMCLAMKLYSESFWL